MITGSYHFTEAWRNFDANNSFAFRDFNRVSRGIGGWVKLQFFVMHPKNEKDRKCQFWLKSGRTFFIWGCFPNKSGCQSLNFEFPTTARVFLQVGFVVFLEFWEKHSPPGHSPWILKEATKQTRNNSQLRTKLLILSLQHIQSRFPLPNNDFYCHSGGLGHISEKWTISRLREEK